jgi:uncharacterized protein YceK
MNCSRTPFNNRISIRIATILFLVTIIISGCATPMVKMYSGAKLPGNQQATIRGSDNADKNTYTRIARVDDERTVDLFTYLFDGGRWAYEVYVLPGKHHIVAKKDIGSQFAWGNLWLVADPGETYIVKVRTEGYSVKMWLENERTGQKVGGIIGDNSEPK